MKLVICFLFAYLSLAAVAQVGAHMSSVDALSAEVQRDQELHTRSLRIVQAAQARAKQPLCPKAMGRFLLFIGRARMSPASSERTFKLPCALP
jgi:hypothetical protein